MKGLLFFITILVALAHPIHAQDFNPSVYLEDYVAGLQHEAPLYGVPTSYDWGFGSTSYQAANLQHALTKGTNSWGEVIPSTNATPPTNTRVEIRNCQYWVLDGAGAWRKIDGPYKPEAAPKSDAGYKADYTGGAPIDASYSNSVTSYKVLPGNNAHFWNGSLNAPINTSTFYQHAFVSCATRLILENPSGNDDRSQANYVVKVGADWRKLNPPWECETNGICISLGHGKAIKVTNNWRLAVFTTLPTAELNKTSSLSLSAFELPDGTLPDGSINVSITPSPTLPETCSRKSEGDANCDGIINLIDYEIWRQEFMTIITTSQANFNGSAGAPDLVDYEIWRRTFVGGAAQPS